MKHGDEHVIASAINDKIELIVEVSKGNDLLLLTIDNRESSTHRAYESAFLSKEGARASPFY